MTRKERLGVGFIGSGFITRFHMRSWVGVRDADVRGVWSPNRERAEEAAALARSLRVGEARAFSSIEEMVAAPEIDCIWVCGPNHARVENMERIAAARSRGAELVGIACEKPLARNAGEARRVVELVEKAGVLHGYLENQLFAPVARARPRDRLGPRRGPVGPAVPGPRRRGAQRPPHAVVLAGRPAGRGSPQRHDVPQPRGGAAPADEAGRAPEQHPPDQGPGADRIPEVVAARGRRDCCGQSMGAEVDYAKRPAEDFARATVSYVDEAGHPLIVEATTSWSFVGAGLRLSMELLGPEYSVSVNTLDAGAKVFFSRRLRGEAGEDLVEKQNAEQGLMPVLGNEAAEYGYEDENRHFVRCFLDGVQPEEDFRAGLEVTELLMTAYMSAEQEKTLAWKPDGLERYVPPVARGRLEAVAASEVGLDGRPR